MVNPEEIRNPDLLLIVGGVGLGVNLLGLLIFCNETIGHHGHSHGGDGHSHGHTGHSHSHEGHSHGHKGHSHNHEGHSIHDKTVVENGVTVFQGVNLEGVSKQAPGANYLEYIVINTGNEQMSGDNSTLDDQNVAKRSQSEACWDGKENGGI